MKFEDFTNPEDVTIGKMSEEDVKRIIKKVFKSSKFLLAILLILGIMGQSIYTINEQEEGVVFRFGKYINTTNAGMHFKIPLIDDVVKVKTTIQSFTFGYDELTDVDNIVSEFENEEAEMITKDFNFVKTDFFIEYKVQNGFDFLMKTDDALEIVKNMVSSSIRSVVNTYMVDEVLTSAKEEIQSKVKENVNDKLMDKQIGLILTQVTLQDSEPSTNEIKLAFDSVENARQEKNTMLNEAQRYRNEIIPKAQSDADKIVQDAEGEKQGLISEAEGQRIRFLNLYNEFVKNKEVTKSRLYLETMESVLKDVTKVIDFDGSTKVLNIGETNKSIVPVGGLENGE